MQDHSTTTSLSVRTALSGGFVIVTSGGAVSTSIVTSSPTTVVATELVPFTRIVCDPSESVRVTDQEVPEFRVSAREPST